MDRALSDNQPSVARHIFVTPKQLRMIADRIESLSDSGLAVKGQVVYPILPDICLYYDPMRDVKYNKEAIKVSSQVINQVEQ